MKRARANSPLEGGGANSPARAICGAPISEAPQDDPPLGITLAGFKHLITSHGGRAAFEDKTTFWVKYNVVLPSTDASLASFVDILAAAGSAHARPATSFVSHAYDDLFLGLVDSLASLESKEARSSPISSPISFSGPTSYYFDLLSVNQHQDCVPGHHVCRERSRKVPYEELSREFGGKVRACGRTLLYLRWADPIPLRRAWCVFELGTTIKEGAPLKVIMPPADVASFKDALQNDFDSLTLKTCSVDVEKAGAKEADDLKFIRRTIQESMGGFLKINQHVIHVMKKWMAKKARKALRALPEEEQGTSALIHNLATFLFWSLGRPSEAEPVYRQALAARAQKLGDEHKQTLLSRANLGLCCSWQGKFDEAEALVSDSASAYRRTLGDSHPDTLSAINNMALVLFTRGKLNEAEALHREVLAKRRGSLGDDDLETARSANNLANVLRDSGKLDEAEALYRVALDKRLSRLGDTHELTVNTIHNLGMVLFSRGKLDEAEPHLKQAWTTRRRTMGDDNEYTLLSFSNVGLLLSEKGDLADSEALFRESLRGFRSLASARFDDYRALSPRVGLAACLRRQGRFDEALPLARDAHKLSREVLSEENLLTCACAHELGVLLRLMGARQQALSYACAAYEGRLRIQGAGSRFTLASQLSLARLQGDGALAASISHAGIKE